MISVRERLRRLSLWVATHPQSVDNLMVVALVVLCAVLLVWCGYV